MAANLVLALINRNDRVVCVDNYCRGDRRFLSEFEASGRVATFEVDCADASAFRRIVRDAHATSPFDSVWHLAANSDIPAGVRDPNVDLRDTFLTTFNTLLIMRDLGIPTLHFASSSAIYGDHGETEIHEDMGPLCPISNYGAMKLASEAQIRAAVEAFLPRADVFRFPNVVGVPATHGVILDFVRKLQSNPDQLDVLGDGSQQKPYLHVSDLVSAMLHIADTVGSRFNVFNIGPPDTGVTVRAIAEAVRNRVSPSASIAYGEGNRGWIGDVPRFRYSTARLAAIGWTPSLNSMEAIERAVDEVSGQEET